MDPDVEELVREQRLEEAADLASVRGDARTASTLFERACNFERAAIEALRAADFARALPLALEGRKPAIAEEALPALLADVGQAERVAFHLERRGDFSWAGRVLEGIGRKQAAARAFERGGDALAAARLLEAEGDVVGAGRVLEAQVRRQPDNGTLLVALGSLLFRYGKTDAAVRALQRVGTGTKERRAALSLLVVALETLGFAQAKAEAEEELTALGGPLLAQEHESPRPLPTRPRLFGRYEIVRDVASSPHARVLECVDGIRSERVAVKVFAGYDTRGGGRDALARFEREVRALAALDHPNVVPLREYLPEGPALVMAWMSGGTLDHMITKGPLTPARAAEIAKAVLAALGEAHRIGIIHRDIKPANVLFDDAGVTRLADFGVAHLSDLTATATAGVIGTLGYMSPEQREGKPATVKSDLYGIGAILWEMLTGEKPTPDTDAASMRVRPSGLHRDLDTRHDALVLSLLAPDPDERPQDAYGARHALGSLAWPDTIEAVGAPRSQRAKSDHPAAIRLVPDVSGGGGVDAWLGRRVVALPLDPPTLARASLFARAEHEALQVVLRVDRPGGVIWLAPPRGERLAGKLTPPQVSSLRAALDRLHELGEPHGAVDAEHVFIDEAGAPTLTFSPSPGPTATKDRDRIALGRLG